MGAHAKHERTLSTQTEPMTAKSHSWWRLQLSREHDSWRRDWHAERLLFTPSNCQGCEGWFLLSLRPRHARKSSDEGTATPASIHMHSSRQLPGTQGHERTGQGHLAACQWTRRRRGLWTAPAPHPRHPGARATLLSPPAARAHVAIISVRLAPRARARAFVTVPVRLGQCGGAWD
jgi:hypothetical protein